MKNVTDEAREARIQARAEELVHFYTNGICGVGEALPSRDEEEEAVARHREVLGLDK